VTKVVVETDESFEGALKRQRRERVAD